ncbi:MAG: hypothetical protein GYB16_13930 [Gammaproteobacteria bacterium]|nr:hypothetical protein [Gammaproteobacteria bacterium]
MKIKYRKSGESISFFGEQNADDIEFCSQRKAQMARGEANFFFRSEVDISSIHSDILALTALIIFGPFAKREIEFDWAISERLKDAIETNFRRRVLSSTHDSERAVTGKGRAALAFSGGVDSVAAAIVMPKDTVSVFCNREVPEGEKIGLYRADAALKACKQLSAYRDVEIVRTDMEFVRHPVGFSVDWTNAAGAVLMSDFYNLNTVAFGMIMESAFFIGHPYFSDLEDRTVYSAWAPIFEAASLPISLPTAMISEVITSKIAIETSLDVNAQSCVRGKEDKPCMNCFKCFRKTILDAKLKGIGVERTHYDMAYTSKEVARRLTQLPIHHENVLAYSLEGLKPTDHPVDVLLRKKMNPIAEYGKGLHWLTSVYKPGFRLVADTLFGAVASELDKYAPLMNEDEINTVNNWDTKKINESDEYVEAHEELVAELKKHHAWMN